MNLDDDINMPKSIIGDRKTLPEKEINTIDPEIVRLKTEIGKLQTEKAALNRKISDYETQIDEYKREMKMRKASDYTGKHYKDIKNNYIHVIAIGDRFPCALCMIVNVEEQSIGIKSLPLFVSAKSRLMSTDPDKLLVDTYSEIQAIEFKEAYYLVSSIFEKSI